MKFTFWQNWRLSSSKLILSLVIYFTLILNYPFIKKVFQSYQTIGTFHDYFIYTVPFVLMAACYVIFSLLLLPVVHKIIMPLIIIISAAISYNTLFFNVYFNRDMLDNVLQTTLPETARMMSVSYIMWLLMLGVLPALAYILTRVQYRIWWREILQRLTGIAVALLVVVGVAAVFYQDYASFFRKHNNFKHIILPSNFIDAGISKIKRLRMANIPYQALGKDAKLAPTDGKRHVTVIVVGETTRAQNWGLNGYTHQTTPKLAERIKKGDHLINFPKVQSCGTATALSVPCMFSSFTRDNYNETYAKRQDNLLDTLKAAGVTVQWVENNSDCKGVCQNIPTTNVIE